MADIRSIHLKLCSLALFRDLLKAPLISSFMDLARQTNNEGKRLAYGEFVASIYLGGGSLTECVRKLVFESENVYVKTVYRLFFNDSLCHLLERSILTFHTRHCRILIVPTTVVTYFHRSERIRK